MLTSRPTHGGGAPLGIDLEAGIAKITVRRPAPDTELTPDPAPDKPADESSTGDDHREDPAPPA